MATFRQTTFLDYTSFGMTTATSVAEAYDLRTVPTAGPTVNVALVLERANDPTALLSSSWGSRQQQLQALNDSGTLWSTYGASSGDYAQVMQTLQDMGIQAIGDAAGSDGYITSPESRTIWVSLDATQFEALFGVPWLQSHSHYLQDKLSYWNGSLSLPSGLPVAGLWFDTPPDYGIAPAVSNLSPGAPATVPQGPQSIGNMLGGGNAESQYLQSNNFAGDIAEWFYNFPLAGIAAPTTVVGLIEPIIGSALNTTHYTFQQGFDAFRSLAGISTSGSYYLVANNGQAYFGNHGERSLDVGVVTSINPASTLGLYVGSGTGNGANSNVFTALQAAFWDDINLPPVVSSSFSILQQSGTQSPFYYAVQQLFIDAALRNITMVLANNDFGSNWNSGNGLANQANNMSSPYLLAVGGTSLTTVAAAPQDSSVGTLYGQAMAGDLQTLWQLIEGGLMTLPTAVPETAAGEATLLEAVWNDLYLSGAMLNQAPTGLVGSDGGVDTTQGVPWYQSAFGLAPTSANPGRGVGRGAPDVSANAGGNMFYIVPNSDMTPFDYNYDEGTSAATPLWASLISQIDTIFADQGLPNLGFANDLFYTAAAIAPASFNDVTLGNNITSFFSGGPIWFGDQSFTLTGYGYYAGPGYDLTTGLGSPNGTLLARALSATAHSQMSFGTDPDMLDVAGSGWQSGADQSLMFQAMSGAGAAIDIGLGAGGLGFGTAASGAYAWTNRLAQQSLQSDFDANLVRLFDKQTQGWVGQSVVASGQDVSVSIDGAPAEAVQGTLSTPFGFADFVSGDGAVRVARAVAVAATAGGADDQVAVVRVRQNGENKLSLTFYEVDDLAGTIDGKRPGHEGYALAVEGRAYELTSGGTSLGGPGYGNYEQAGLLGVDAGDLVAMKLTNQTTGAHFWAFAHANETVAGQPVGHLWNYGLNTWGWEDTFGGGDRDFNDLIVGIDFTSASGHGWLV